VVVLQSLAVDGIVSDSHEQGVDAPHGCDYTYVHISSICEVHSEESHILYEEIDEAVAYVSYKVAA